MSQDQSNVAPPFAAPASQQDTDLLGEVFALASCGLSHGLLADGYCGQIVEKIKAAAPEVVEAARQRETASYRLTDAEKMPCAHCGRAPADVECCDWIECPAGSAELASRFRAQGGNTKPESN